MNKGKTLLITSILLMNVLFLLPSLIYTPAEALDYGMDEDLGNVDASFLGENNGDLFGISAGVGDVNGDGYDDILIGAPGNDDSGDFSGKTYLIFGSNSGWTMDTDLSSVGASFLGEGEMDHFGGSTGGVGDVNGDGYNDILISAHYNDESRSNAGQTYLIMGKSSGWTLDTDISTSDASFLGERSEDLSGSSIAIGGDINGDGYDDILISARGNDEGGTRAGQTYLIFGKASGWAMDTDLSVSDASFWGEDHNDYSGYSVAGAGDVNDDGYDDILIGAYQNDEGGNMAGQTYLILGKASGWAMDTDLSDSDASFWGENEVDMSGFSVAGGGDVNGDGYDDILIGAYNNDEGGSNAGQTYLIFGKASGWAKDTDLSASDASFWGEDADDWSGHSVSIVGDVNGDGYDDILIGATGDDDGGSKAGQIYLILGKSSGWTMDTDLSDSDASYWGEDENDSSAFPARAEDINGDGYNDFLCRSIVNDEGGKDAGQSYLIFPDHNSKPTSITSVKAYSEDEYTHQITYAEPGDKIYIELQGTDGLASRKNIAEVWVQGSSNPNKDFKLRLHETGENSGKFRGNFTIANRTHARYQWINATGGGWVQVTSRQDPTKFVNLSIGQGIEIEPKPSIVYAPEDYPFSLHFSAGGIIPDSWQFDTNASWLQWDGSTKNISGTPDNSHVGTYWAELRAESTDAYGSVNFTVQVNNTNPSIITDSPTTAYEKQEYIVDFNSSDDGQGTITWYLDTDADWLNLDAETGVLNGTPTETNIGTFTVNVSIHDGNGGWDFTEFDLEVFEKNDPPDLTDLIFIPQELFRGQTATIYIEASDPENGTEMEPPVLETRSPTSIWNKINCSYNFDGNNYTAEYGTDATTETGKHSFRVKLTDLQNLSSNWYYVNDTLTVKNNLPFINDTFENIAVYSDQNTIMDLVSYADDYENSPTELTWEVVEYSPLILFDAYMKNSTAVEIWPSSPDRTGMGKIKFRITDEDGGEYARNITLEILSPAERPKITISLESPENGSTVGNASVNLTWKGDGYEGKISYSLYFGDSKDDMSLKSEELDGTNVQISDLTDGTTYYWKVTATAEGIPTVFESETWHFTVQFGFVPTHKIELSFNTASVSVKRGDSALVTLTFKNLGDVTESVTINVMGELKDYVSMDNIIWLGVGEEKTININILALSKLQLKTYDLTIETAFSGEKTTASITVTVTSEKGTRDEGSVMSWFWFIIGAILILAIAGLLIFLILRRRKKTDDEGEVIDAEIEGRARSGITKADLDMLAIGKGQSGAESFQGRLSEPLQYTLPSQQTYQHKPLPTAPQVTLPELKVTGAVKEEPKALPQTAGTSPVVTSKPVPTVSLPQTADKKAESKPPEVPALPMKSTVPGAPTPSKPIPPPTTETTEHPKPHESHAPPEPAPTPSLSAELFPGEAPVPSATTPEAPLPPPTPAPQDSSSGLQVGTRKKPSFMDVKHTMLFKLEEPMPCSICYGSITEGLQAIRCNCGNIGHVSCGIKVGKCPECGTGYEDVINRASEQAIIESVQDSEKTAKVEVEVKVEWDEKGDMMRNLLKQLLNKEITVDEYKLISKDIKESF